MSDDDGERRRYIRRRRRVIDDTTPLGEVRAWLDAHVEHGIRCPCCDQFAKIYRRSLSSSSAAVMIVLWRDFDEGRDYGNVPQMFNTTLSLMRAGTGDGTKGQWWGLMEPQPGDREDGSSRNGWWRLTDPGRAFVVGSIRVPKYAYMYNGECLGLDGELWSVRDALGNRFNYRELMDGV